MKILLTIILCLLTTACFSQTYEAKKIIAKADSILKVTTGEKLYQFFNYDPKAYYTYSIKNELKSETLDKKLKTKGDFKKATVNYNFHSSNYPWIYGYASIIFDSLLNQEDSISINFIPEFLRKGDEFNFISNEQAIQIAIDSVLKGRVKRIEGVLEFNPFKITGYCWVVSNYLSEDIDTFGNKYGKVDMVLIDPVTSKILKYWYAGEYGPLY